MTTFLLHLEADIDLPTLTALLEGLGATEGDCVAFRLYMPDGRFWDGYVGGSDDEIQAALASLAAGGGRGVH